LIRRERSFRVRRAFTVYRRSIGEAMAPAPHLNRIGTAHAPHDIHRTFVEWAELRLPERRDRAIFRRMAQRSGIARRWSVLPPDELTSGFYGDSASTPTAPRMALYAEAAPELALEAIKELGDASCLERVTHIVVASCTGFVAPGIDQILARRLGLSPQVERTLIGFMGCYAAVTALRTAWHIVRSQPDARVLVVTVELCSLHLQPEANLEQMLAMMLFGDGAAAALVSADRAGLELHDPFSIALPESEDLITWRIGDHGFAMGLSGEVPARLTDVLRGEDVQRRLTGGAPVDSWSVHAGGRSILDAVAQGMGLPPDALGNSRKVLEQCGNMSSSTLMFVLARVLAEGETISNGRAVAFGPGLAAEGFGYRSAE
jgi:alpha-pyrone synthase